jgi:hypothetical protein
VIEKSMQCSMRAMVRQARRSTECGKKKRLSRPGVAWGRDIA